MIRYLRDNLPPDTVIFANGNILNHTDLEQCLKVTGADGVMSAEGNLSDPTIFAKPPPIGEEGREYWRGKDGHGGYRIDAVMRRYLDIIYRDILEQDPPQRSPLFMPGDPEASAEQANGKRQLDSDVQDEPRRKKQKQDGERKVTSPNLKFMQGHLFQLFRPFVGTFTHIRNALGKSRVGDMAAFEHVLELLEQQVKEALLEEAQKPEATSSTQSAITSNDATSNNATTEPTPELRTNKDTIATYRRPWFVCQPFIRPLPEEAIERGALQMSKKELANLEKERSEGSEDIQMPPVSSENSTTNDGAANENVDKSLENELPREAVVCG